ncbi:MAG: FAD-binding oxidoreductase [Pseudomonadota bacterium]
MMTDQPISLWDTSAAEAVPDAANSGHLEGGRAVDVAIIGGGYTGLSTALHCAQKGLSALVLEAHQIGQGGSGRNVGLVNAAAWLPPQEVRARLGPVYGPRFVERFGAAPDYVFSLIERHQIRCEARQNGTIHAAHNAAGLRSLEARHRAWQALGAPVELLSRSQAADMIGSPRFHGGLLDRRAGTINPMGYCRGLARAAIGAGATVSTGLPAQRLTRVAGRWRVETGAGALEAKSVVLATNAYTDTLWPGLTNEYTPIHYFQLATEPLGQEAAHILPARQGVWDTGKIMQSIRRDAEDRLIVGSMGRVIGDWREGPTQRFAKRLLARLFPDLAVTFSSAWHGVIALTDDHLPRIHHLDEGLYAPIGYNGRGITTGTVLGAVMADVLTGAPPDTLPLPLTAPRPARAPALMARLYDTAFTANQMIKGF